MVQTVQKIVKFLARVLPDSAENQGCLARCCKTGVVQTVQETVKFPLAFLDLVLCPSLCNDRCRMVETVQKTVECPQLVLLLDKVVDVPVLATSWGSRGSAAAVHRLVCQLIMAMMSSCEASVIGAVYTGTRPGLTPPSGGERVAGTPGACSQAVCHPK